MRKITPLVAAGAMLALGLSACGGGGGGGGTSNPPSSFNAALNAVVNPSTAKGGIVRLANAGDWDSPDPGNTYYAYTWNFARLYARTLVMFKPSPGADSTKLVPDLATNLGEPSKDLKTWTYHLRPGVKFEDGTPVTSKDVKYAVERSIDSTTFPNSPTYFHDYLDLQGYTGPYQDKTPDKLGLKAVETPNDSTIIFHLAKPFSEFDYFAQLPNTSPVPQAKDTGAKYQSHVVATGPYMFKDYTPGKSLDLVKNPNWDPSTDPNRKQLADGYNVQLNANPNDVDKRLLNGTLDVDILGTGVQPATQGQILSNPKLKQYADSSVTTRLWFTAISASVAPFDNIHCRKAVQYATDKTAMQTAYGGPITGGDIATTLLPPTIPGYQKFDDYPVGADGHGDLTKAKEELTLCGKPAGFKTVISARAERPKEVGAAVALQQGLAKIGITAEIRKFPQSDYAKLYAGNPAYVKKNGLGIMMYGWGVDWNDGFGDLSQIVDSRVIRPAGNTNFGVKDPKVDALIDKAVATTDATARDAIWGQVDKQVMDDAYYIPFLNAKGLYYRPPNLKNVWVNPAYNGEYDYLSLSAK
jgi:peptide/nickel transport system substrate-binding protein